MISAIPPLSEAMNVYQPLEADPAWYQIIYPEGETSSIELPKYFEEVPKINSIETLIKAVAFKRAADLSLLQFLQKRVPIEESEVNYAEYFQYENPRIQKLTDGIIDPSWSDDQKAYVAEQYVIDLLEYIPDLENYGQNEYWALPTQTLDKKSGDCEDGALFIISIMLHAGVDPSKIFFYGGTVREDGRLELGGHGWVGYKRSDGEIVPLDWCFYPTSNSLEDRPALKDNRRYYDDYFVATLYKTVMTEYENWVRNPEDIRIIAKKILEEGSFERASAIRDNGYNRSGAGINSRLSKSLGLNMAV